MKRSIRHALSISTAGAGLIAGCSSPRSCEGFLDSPRYFACSSFKDRNNSGYADTEDIVGGPRNEFCPQEPFELIGWDPCGKNVRMTLRDADGTLLLKRERGSDTPGGFYVRLEEGLSKGEYNVQWEHQTPDACRWAPVANFMIYIPDHSPSIPVAGQIKRIW